MIKIKVPATTANVGPGFDSIGIALNIFNSITVDKLEKEQTFTWDNGIVSVPIEENLIYIATMKTLKKYNAQNLGFSIHMVECNIPISRGLGSSAAAIVLGIYAANYLLKNILTIDEIINIATEIEGHPDNVVPAIIGGMVISIKEDNEILFSSVNFPKDINFNVMIPNFKLSTTVARSVLPSSYSREECVHNISRVSMLVNSLTTRDYSKLRPCLKDSIHQPFRMKLINNGDRIMKESEKLNSLGEFISGAGPTIISLTCKNNIDFKNNIITFLDELEDSWELKIVDINSTGTISEVI